VHLGSGTFRLDEVRLDRVWLVAGQSLAEQDHLEGVLRDGEGLAAPVLLLAMFAGSLVIGLRALSPVEQSRRRQLEFTADASHELRTPLSVISAETGIALSAPRKASDYRAALARIQGESQRLRRIVEDLLWLARFDSEPPPPGAEPLDLATIAEECAGRFQRVARSQSPGISVAAAGSEPAWISAPPEWIDRLAGVLVDNACRYAGPAGAGRRSGARAGHRGLDRALDRRSLANRRISAGRSALRGLVAPPPVTAARPPIAAWPARGCQRCAGAPGRVADGGLPGAERPQPGQPAMRGPDHQHVRRARVLCCQPGVRIQQA